MASTEPLTTIKALLGISDTTQDALLNTYITLAKKELIAWRYGLTRSPEIAKAVNSEGNTVRVSASLFIAQMSPTSGTSYVFTYSKDDAVWQYNSTDIELIDYGITCASYLVDGETITVKYNENYIAEYAPVLAMACVVGYGLGGVENEVAHSENGIARTFKYSDMVDYIHSHVLPYIGVF